MRRLLSLGPRPADQGPESFHEWVRNQFGERLFSIFFKTYTEKVWGMSCDDISADWAAQRIKGLDLGAAIRDGVKRSLGLHRPAAGDGAVIKTLIESFRYPRRGPGMMWDAAAAAIRGNGGRVLLDRRVDGLSYDDRDEALDGERPARGWQPRDLHGPQRRLLGADPRARRRDPAGAPEHLPGPLLALPRLRHRGADRAGQGQLSG